MPSYSYYCAKCKKTFEIFSTIKNYNPETSCDECHSICDRDYGDLLSISTSIRKSDSELKTIGDLALRNSEKMSNDEKQYLYTKHNSYKENISENPLPQGMSRIKKPPKPKWPGARGKIRRKTK